MRVSAKVLVGFVAAGLVAIALARLRPGAEWPGVDDAVIGRFVVEAGRPAPRPVLDWLRGDTLLFAFLCAGLLAGFGLGYWGRALFVERAGAPAPSGARDA
ncbi:MAG: hypothetical protein NVSMB47_11970 [Polyangiales bacterium]